MNIVKKALIVLVMSAITAIAPLCIFSSATAGDSGDSWEGIPSITLRYPDREKGYEQCIKQQGHQCPRSNGVTISITDLGKFHGDVCPGISLGYRACQVALSYLYPGEIPPRGDQFVVSGAERPCPTDAITYITGSRYGKMTNGILNGNFVFDKSIGDFSFIFASLSSGKAVKLVSLFPLPKEFMDLKEKVRLPDASPEEKERFSDMGRCLSLKILTAPEKEIYEVVPITDLSWKKYMEKDPKSKSK
jgi:formylmethanofuran dehydrogenase subunit E